MKLLMAATTSAAGQSGAVAIDPDKSTVPYTHPPVYPFNADRPMVSVTNLGDSNTVHPSVLDFGTAGFQGHRYWMAITDYGSSAPAPKGNENPHIFYSDDCYNWIKPAGAPEPISYPAIQTPAWAGGVNSDTELVHSGGKLHMFWREYVESSGAEKERLFHTESADGASWSTPVSVLETAGKPYALISPCIVYDGTQWVMHCWSDTANIRTASSLNGPWSAASPTTGHGKPWHGGVWYDAAAGIYYGLGCGASSAGTAIWTIASRDGIAWTKGPDVIVTRDGKWDDWNIYRPSLQPHPDGTHFRVWYSCQSTTLNWTTGYTMVPRSYWPSV